MKDEYWAYEEILSLDMGKRVFDTDSLRHMVANVLTQLPVNLIRQVYEDCYFLTSDPEKLGVYISRDVIGNRHVIVLSRRLYKEPLKFQSDVILHEIAHYKLNHKSWDERFQGENRDPIDLIATTHNQEKEAHDLKKKWLAEYRALSERG